MAQKDGVVHIWLTKDFFPLGVVSQLRKKRMVSGTRVPRRQFGQKKGMKQLLGEGF